MNSKKILNRYLSSPVWMRVIALITFMLIVLFVICFAFVKNENPDESTSFDSINSKQGGYSYIDVVAISHWLYKEDSSVYYIAYDANNFTYVVRLSDKKFNEMSAQYDYYCKGDENAPKPVPYRLYGLVSLTSRNISDAVASSCSLSVFEYEQYFGKMFLDATTAPSTERRIVFVVCAFASLLFFLCFFTPIKRNNRNRKKCLERLEELQELDNAVGELHDSENEVIGKSKVKFSRHFIFNKETSTVLKFDDIIWCYERVVSQYNVVRFKQLISNTKTLRNIVLIQERGKDKNGIIQYLLNVIAQYNPSALIGFTSENANAYNNYVWSENVRK